eukprot:2038174-Prorocentrum_lima.AAC.1
MLDGIHALARLDDALNGFEYTSVQVSVSEGMTPHIGRKQFRSVGQYPWEASKEDCHGWSPKRDEQ